MSVNKSICCSRCARYSKIEDTLAIVGMYQGEPVVLLKGASIGSEHFGTPLTPQTVNNGYFGRKENTTTVTRFTPVIPLESVTVSQDYAKDINPYLSLFVPCRPEIVSEVTGKDMTKLDTGELRVSRHSWHLLHPNFPIHVSCRKGHRSSLTYELAINLASEAFRIGSEFAYLSPA